MKNRFQFSLLRGAFLTFALAGTFAPTAQAAPPRQAPAYGYRAKLKTPKKAEKRDLKRRDERTARTLTGRVDHVDNSQNFDLSVANRRVHVRTASPIHLQNNAKVRVVGRYDGSLFRARSVEVLDRNANANENRRLEFSGVILERQTARQLRVRADKGQIYTVRADANFSNRITQNDRIRVTGRLTREEVRNAPVVKNARVTLLKDASDSKSVDFVGTLLRFELKRNRAQVRGDNGRLYTLRYDRSRLDDFRVGDRVRIEGEAREGLVYVSRLRRA